MNRPSITAREARQRGAALLVLMLVLGLLAAYFAISALNRSSINERNRLSANTLAQAKDALIGFAAAYRDNAPTHANQVFGYLPCPDMTNSGTASASPTCPAQDISATGRLPWNTLGLPALRESAGECLWYAVSGSAKDVNKTASFNWDTLGQYIVQDFGGATLVGATPHERPLAVILSPGGTIGAQTRAMSASECGGSNTITDYLEGIAAPVAGITTITVATASSVSSGTNNDQALWISSKEIFDRVKVRSDFKSDIDGMIGDLATCLNNLPPAGLPLASATNKGITNVIAVCPAATPQKVNVLNNWQNNLLYANPGTASTVQTGSVVTTGCNAVLLFGGERTATQVRDTAANKDLAANYLEAPNVPLPFPNSGAYSGLAGYNSASSSSDIVRCIKGLPAGGAQVSFANDFGSFVTTGVGVTTNVAVPGSPTVSINNAAGASGGCFWYPNSIPLAGKVLRLFYKHQFSFADPVGGADRGNGFSFQMVRSDLGSPSLPANPASEKCGTQANMGVLNIGTMRGLISYVIETDVHQDLASNNDPAENHTAIMLDGNLTHSPTNGNPTLACNGSAAGCRHTPVNKFEESPPANHNQRVEIHTGCDSTCAACNPAAHVAPNTYARVSVWVDCTDCSDVVADLDRVAQVPTVNRCMAVNPAMNSIYFGFTGGFRSGASQQGVTLSNMNLRSE